MLSSQDPGASAKLQRNGRVLVDDLALTLQAAVLLQHAPIVVAEAFVNARMGDDAGSSYGALPEGVNIDLLIKRV